MVQGLNHVATQSGIIYKATHLYGQDKEMVDTAYELLGIHDNELIKTKAQRVTPKKGLQIQTKKYHFLIQQRFTNRLASG